MKLQKIAILVYSASILSGFCIPVTAGELEIVEKSAKIVKTCSIPNFVAPKAAVDGDYFVPSWRTLSKRRVLVFSNNVFSIPEKCKFKIKVANGYVFLP